MRWIRNPDILYTVQCTVYSTQRLSLIKVKLFLREKIENLSCYDNSKLL